LVLDYCPGGDLGRILEKERRLTEDRARIYLAEVLLALEDLHSRDIIFRDLKPDNVVLDSGGHALLTDFGLSKQGVLDNQGA
jgi:serine/threonine protein kinase